MSTMTERRNHIEFTESGRFGRDTSGLHVTRLVVALRQWSERASQRRHLSRLTRRELEDVGISPEAAAAEVAKPFWRA